MPVLRHCVCGKDYWFPGQRWHHEACLPVANAVVANTKRKPGKYKDPEARKKYMRELMRKVRSK